jgi:hypothetical protein
MREVAQSNSDDRRNQTEEHREYLETLARFRDWLLRSSIVNARLEDGANGQSSLVVERYAGYRKREGQVIAVAGVDDREQLRYLKEYIDLVIDETRGTGLPQGDGQLRYVGEDFQKEFSELGEFWRSAFFRSASDRYKHYQFPG